MPLDQSFAFITGSSRGIGRGIALRLAERGVRIAVHYFRNADAAAETVRSVRSASATSCGCCADPTPDGLPVKSSSLTAEHR